MNVGSVPGDGGGHAGIEAALANLDPTARAALELSIRHHRTPAEVAEFTGIAEDRLIALRREALDSIAADLGIAGPGSRGEVVRRLEGRTDRTEPADGADSGDDEDPALRSSAPPERSTGSSRRWIPVLLLALVAALAIVVVASLRGSGEGEGTDGVAESVPADVTGANETPAPQPIALTPLPGTPGRGTVEVTIADAGGGPRLVLKLAGLPDPKGEYRAWLYTSLIDSRPLGSTRSGDGRIEAELPEDLGDFELLDLSVQEPRSASHSGSSVFRVPLDELGAGG